MTKQKKPVSTGSPPRSRIEHVAWRLQTRARTIPTLPNKPLKIMESKDKPKVSGLRKNRENL